MPQLDLVTFPSQIFWLAIIFIIFFAFVSGHFVPILHKIIQTRSKKAFAGQDNVSDQSGKVSVVTGSEVVLVSALDKSISGLSTCVNESAYAQSKVLGSGDKLKISSFANIAGSIQGRFIISRGLLFIEVFSPLIFLIKKKWLLLMKLFLCLMLT